MDGNVLAGHKWWGPQVADQIMGMHPLIFLLVILAIIVLILIIVGRRRVP
jgi:hypothetical protein